MPLLTSQEKNITIFLLSTAIIGSVIGIFRHNLLQFPNILLSTKNLPSYIKENKEREMIETHNSIIGNQLIKSEIIENNIGSTDNDHENILVQNSYVESAINKIEPNKKKITQNTSGIININSGSKEDFMTLPYIGEVKAERIIQARNESGRFVSIKDLEKVNGIGPKTLAKIEPFITI